VPAGRDRGPRRLEAALLLAVAAAAAALFVARGPFRSRTSLDDDRRLAPHALSLAVSGTFGPGAAADLAPVARFVERTVGIRLRPRDASPASRAVTAVADGSADLALVSALACVQAHTLDAETRYVAVHATAGEWTSTAALFVRQDGGAGDLGRLRGRRLCAADPSSTEGHLLVRAALRQHGAPPHDFFGDVLWAGHHEGAVAALADGRCDAAAVPRRTVARSRLAASLREVRALGVVPGACWIARSGLDTVIVEALTDALVAFDPTAETGRDRVGRFLEITGFRPADATTFQAVLVSARLEGLLPQPSASPAGAAASDLDPATFSPSTPTP
jgi:ABC-type phosphate/phosphonate transport system substrate-binding protein